MQIGFVGAGRMAAALARGAVDAGLCTAAQVRGSARTAASRERFAAEVPGVPASALSADNQAAAAGCEVVFLCVKPADARAVLAALAPALRSHQLVVSVAAGVPLADLQAAAGLAVPLVRAMPNTPALVRRGASAYARGGAVTDAQAALVERLLGAVGEVHAVPEPLLDAVNGVSGSGPAYALTFLEALADGGVLMGLPRPLALALAVQTVAGAAELVRQTGLHPAPLREAIASPGGTTMAAIEALENRGLRAAVLAAVRAATERARELGRPGPGPGPGPGSTAAGAGGGAGPGAGASLVGGGLGSGAGPGSTFRP